MSVARHQAARSDVAGLRLLNPGPVTLSPRVRAALAGPDLCHRQPEYTAIQAEVLRALADVYRGPGWEAVLLGGSGTTAVEAMVGTFVPAAGRALVVANGAYGDRLATILERQGKPHAVARAEWTEPMRLDLVERELGGEEYTHVVAVHHETTTGRLNDLASLASLCADRGTALLVDAVSSFGAEAMDLEGWNVEACAATANKCIHGAAGVAFVLAREDALARPSAAPSFSLDLALHHREQARGSVLVTPPVPAVLALREALAELADEGGWRGRNAAYRERSGALRTGLARLGFAPLLPEAARSSSLTAFDLPPGATFDALYDGLRDRGFVIYPGQRSLAGRIFRVAVMGALTAADVEEAVEAFGDVMAARAAEAS